MSERIQKLEYELNVLDDMANFGLLHDGDEPFDPFTSSEHARSSYATDAFSIPPLAYVDSDDSNEEITRVQKRPRRNNTCPAWYNILSQLYLLCAFLLFVGPLQELMPEISQAFKSSFLTILQGLGSLTFDILKGFGTSPTAIHHHINDHWCDTYAPMVAPIF